MELGQQNVTLKTLEQIWKRLKCSVGEVFTAYFRPAVRKQSLDKQLAIFRRGQLSYAALSKKVGISDTTLDRIERGKHRLTVDKLQTVLERLKIKLSEVFPDEY